MNENESRENTSGKKSTMVGYIVSISICVAAVVAVMIWKGVFTQPDAKSVFGVLSDAFFIPGVIFAGVGGLSRLGAWGAYDTFGYIFSRFSFHNIWVTGARRKKYDSLYDYKQKKNEKGRRWLPYVLWTGLGALVVSIVLLVMYLIL